MAETLKDRHEFQRALRRISALEASGRSRFFVSVVEKFSKRREAQVPIDLFVATLEYAVDRRQRVVEALAADSDALWLSATTGHRLTTRAISDLLKRAFNAEGIRGSGHRLRAAFAGEFTLSLYKEAYERFGPEFRPEDILFQVAEVLGHENTNTLRPYLNSAIAIMTIGGSSERAANEDRLSTAMRRELLAFIREADHQLVRKLLYLIRKLESSNL